MKISTSRTKAPYFNQLNRLVDQHKLTPAQILNMDEKRVMLEHTPPRIVAHKGSRVVQSRVSSSCESITVLGSISAAGNCMPPMIIVRGKTPRSLNIFSSDEGPVGAFWTYQQKAWMDDALGHQWFNDVFLKHWPSASSAINFRPT